MSSKRLKIIQAAITKSEFAVPPLSSTQSIEFSVRLAHIGDQVVSLAVTDLIQGHYPRLRVGPTSVRRCIVLCIVFIFSPQANQKLRDRLKCGDALAEM